MTTPRRIRHLLVATCLFLPHMLRAQLGGQFMYPISVAVDPSGNVLVSENARHRIGKYGPSGALGWRKGSQGSADGQFNSPAGIATDASGFVYVADLGNARVQKLNSGSGAFVTKWGSPGSGPGQFRKPRAVAVDAQNNVSVLDSQTLLIQKFSSDGTVYFGSWGGRTGTGDGQLSTLAAGPGDLAIDPLGFAYVSDPANQRIQRWRIVSNAAGAIQSATFIGWSGRCTSGTNCDVANARSDGFTCTARTCSAPSAGSGPGQFMNPNGLTLDAGGNLFVADSVNNRVQQFSSAGQFVREWGSRGTLPGEFRSPIDVAASPTGDLFVADFQNERLQRFSNTGVFQAVFGGSIHLSASLGYPPSPFDALVDPNPLFVFPGGTTTATVRVTSVGAFQGQVTLDTPGCCEDLASRALMPGAVTASLGPATVSVPASGAVDSTLSVAAPATAVPGRFLVPLSATNTTLGVGAAAGVAVEILARVPPSTGVASPCIGGTVVGSVGGGAAGTGPEVVPLSAVTSGLYATKAAAPARTSFTIGMKTVSNLAGWIITVAKAAMPLRSDQAYVLLSNTTAWDKSMSNVNSANCVAAGQIVRVSTNQSAGFVISKADTTTLLLGRRVCRARFIWCWDDGGWDSLATFDEAAFWSLFGGRQVTIDWFFSQKE